MSFPRHAHYADSGSGWLGEYPSHWRAVPLWTLFWRTKRQDHADEELLSVYREHGVVPKASRDDNNNKPSDDLSAYQLVEVGDLVINKMKAWQGSVAISRVRGIVSPAYFTYQATHQEDLRYLHYLMRSQRYITGYLSLSKGIRIGQWDLEPQYHSRMPVLLPPRDEQRCIADLLDHETAKIDALVAEQRRLIDLLKEKRQAVISRAVTKGLDPNVPMKDSEADWLGKVPAHWEVRKINSLSTKITNGYVGPTRDILVDEGIRYLQSLHIKGNRIKFDAPYFVAEAWSHEHKKSILETGDLLIVQTGDIGQAAVVTDEFAGCNCHALIIVSPLRDVVFGEYLGWVFNSDYGKHSLLAIQTGALHPHLNCGNVKDVFVPVPPKLEQSRIVEHCVAATSAFDELMSEAEAAVALLNERRAALVTAAVTGRIDVRSLALRTDTVAA